MDSNFPGFEGPVTRERTPLYCGWWDEASKKYQIGVQVRARLPGGGTRGEPASALPFQFKSFRDSERFIGDLNQRVAEALRACGMPS